MIETASIDWNREWQSQMALWQDTAGKSCREFWADEDSARVYSEKYGKHHLKRIQDTIGQLPLEPHTRVLDIGAGPGNLALPMAAQARSVTTVEPSAGMNRVMTSDMALHDTDNIIQVEKSWEEIDPDLDLEPPYDLVLASMSLGMTDIRAAIEKMNRVCSGRVVLFWHAGIPEWEKMPRALWPQFFNKDYHGGPKSDVLFQVLYQMGIYPDIRVHAHHFTEVFPTLDDALAFYHKRFTRLEARHDKALAAFLETHCKKTDQGWVHQFEHKSMKFSWAVKEAFRETA